MTETITVSPNPAKAGKSIQVCRTFNTTPPTSATIRVTWDLPNGQTEVVDITVTADNPCGTTTVPTNARGGVAEDLSGDASDVAIAVG